MFTAGFCIYPDVDFKRTNETICLNLSLNCDAYQCRQSCHFSSRHIYNIATRLPNITKNANLIWNKAELNAINKYIKTYNNLSIMPEEYGLNEIGITIKDFKKKDMC